MLRPLGCITAFLLAAGAPAVAQEGPGIGPRTGSIWPPGEERCYRAVFDDKYLAAHKGQTLEEIQFYRVFGPNGMKEAIEPPMAEAEAADKGPDAANWADVVVRMRGLKGLYDQSVSCHDDTESPDNVRCYVDCDGGGFNVKSSADGLAVSFEDGNGLSLNQSCGDPDEEHGTHWLTDVEAGKSLTLKSFYPEACYPMDREARPAFAADPKPLREYITEQGWNCLSRTYDKDHLAKHPQQKVAAIAFRITAGPARKQDEYGSDLTYLDGEFSILMRDGKHASQPVECLADEYQYRCGGAFRLRRRDQGSAMLLAGEYGADGGDPPTELNGLALGSDDMVFRLDGSKVEACEAR